MKIAVWGAGNIGAGIVHRLTVSEFTDEIIWINHNLEKVDRQAADVKHGLAMIQKDIDVHPVSQERAGARLRNADVLVLSQGKRVAVGETRNDVFTKNRVVFKPVLDALENFHGIVLVVSNPVDLMTRELIIGQNNIPLNRIMGLGTVVETSRMRFAIADRLAQRKHPRDIDAFAIGTHDENFVPVICEPGCPVELHESVRREVARAANRVKGSDEERPGATVFPIVEGCYTVIRAVATNTPTKLTVSVLDQANEDKFCYSLPCVIDASGWSERDEACIEQNEVQGQMDKCLEGLRSVLRQSETTSE